MRLLTLRNQPILFHGILIIGKESALKFKELVELFLKMLLKEEGKGDINTKLKRHKFPKLPVNLKKLFNLKQHS